MKNKLLKSLVLGLALTLSVHAHAGAIVNSLINAIQAKVGSGVYWVQIKTSIPLVQDDQNATLIYQATLNGLARCGAGKMVTIYEYTQHRYLAGNSLNNDQTYVLCRQ